MSFTVYTTESGEKFRCTQSQADTLDKLKDIIAGGIGTVHGYVATSNRTVPEKADIQFITHFSTERLNERKAAALSDLTYEDIAEYAEKSPKVQALAPDERVALFEQRRQQELDSIQKTADGDRSDAHRQGHDRCYIYITKGVKIHFRTFDEKYTADDGTKKKRKMPEIVGGLPVAESIMLSILELKRTVIEPGEYKVVNSGPSVLIKNAMMKGLNSRSVGLKTLSLKEDNFDSLVVSRKTFLAEEFKQIPADLFLPA